MARDEQPAAVASIRDFPGLQLEADERDVAPGATHLQENFASDEIGQLRSSLRYRLVSFDDNYQTGYWG